MNQLIAAATIIFLCVALISDSYAATTPATAKEVYELQERCRKDAEDLFRRNFGAGYIEGPKGVIVARYSNHYNVRMNHCFMLLTVAKGKVESPVITITLSDVNENKNYGHLTTVGNEVVDCSIANKRCYSEEEWNSFVQPYMEE